MSSQLGIHAPLLTPSGGSTAGRERTVTLLTCGAPSASQTGFSEAATWWYLVLPESTRQKQYFYSASKTTIHFFPF